MTLANVYQVIDRQRFPTGELIENVYFYNNSGEDGDAEDLAAAFNLDVVSFIRPMQSQFVSHTEIIVQSLGSPADFAALALTGADGDYSEDALSAFTAVNFTLRPNTRAIRPGSKRIGGLPDNAGTYTNGVITASPMLTLLEALRTALKTSIDATGPDYFPVLVKRIFVPADEPEHGAYYRLPISDGELVTADIVNTLVNTTLTHQTSRGNGR